MGSYAPVERCYLKIGQNIAAVREERGYSQEYLAILLRRSRKHVSLIEVGRERFMLHTVCKIARILRCKPGRLTRGVWT